jgi:hypothetical protein
MSSPPGAEADPVSDAVALVERADAAGIPLRIVGGLAVRALCPEFAPREADDQDLDLACVSERAGRLTEVLGELGLEPDAEFNAVHGRRQMRFSSQEEGLAVDVILDRFEMSHQLDFRERIERLPHTLDPTDLLLSKLQIHELNAKDQHDIVLLLAKHPIAETDDPTAISLPRFGEVVAGDWGWWRTVTGNLDRIAGAERASLPIPPGAPQDPVAAAARLRAHADEVPKSLSWRMRAKVGERVRWYELPEEVEEV